MYPNSKFYVINATEENYRNIKETYPGSHENRKSDRYHQLPCTLILMEDFRILLVHLGSIVSKYSSCLVILQSGQSPGEDTLGHHH